MVFLALCSHISALLSSDHGTQMKVAILSDRRNTHSPSVLKSANPALSRPHADEIIAIVMRSVTQLSDGFKERRWFHHSHGTLLVRLRHCAFL